MKTIVQLGRTCVIFRGGIEIEISHDGVTSVNNYPYEGVRTFANFFERPNITIECDRIDTEVK